MPFLGHRRSIGKDKLMVSNTLAKRIFSQLNAEIIRRLLLQYFYNKGIENVDNLVHPALMSDIHEQIPELINKIEVIPHADEIDPTTGYTKLGWNMFVLGNKKLFLGYTEHANATGLDFNRPETLAESPARDHLTARKIIKFVVNSTKGLEAGRIRDVDVETISMSPSRATADTGSGQFFRRDVPARPEGGGGKY